MAGRAIFFGRKGVRIVDSSQVTEFFRDEVARQPTNKHTTFRPLAKFVRRQNIPEISGAGEMKLAERVVFTTNR